MICGSCKFVVTEQELRQCPKCGNTVSWQVRTDTRCEECGALQGVEAHDIRCSTRCKAGDLRGTGEQCLRGFGHKGEHEFKGLRVQAKVQDGPRGFRIIEHLVTDPVQIAMIQKGTRPGLSVSYSPVGGATLEPIPVGYRGPAMYVGPDDPNPTPAPSRTAGFDHLYDAARYGQPDWKKIEPLPVDLGPEPDQLVARGDVITSAPFPDTVLGIQPANDFQCPAMLAGKFTPAVTCRKRRGHPGDHFAPVGDHGAYYTWSTVKKDTGLGQIYVLHPPPMTAEMREVLSKWKVEVGETIDATPPENYEALERMIRDQLIREGKHLRSVPMPDDTDTKPNRVGFTKKRFASHLKWFMDEAKRVLDREPDITFKAFIERLENEPEEEQPAGLTCILCGEPAAPRSQMCETHERQEADEIEGHIQVNRERNGSSADTRRYAISKLNEFESQLGKKVFHPETTMRAIVVLLEVSGVRPQEVSDFVERSMDDAQGHSLEEWLALKIANARGMVLAIQMLREGPDPSAPSPLRPRTAS